MGWTPVSVHEGRWAAAARSAAGSMGAARLARACARAVRLVARRAWREAQLRGLELAPDDAALVQEILAGEREPAFDAAWAKGQALTLEQAMLFRYIGTGHGSPTSCPSAAALRGRCEDGGHDEAEHPGVPMSV